MSTLYLPTLDSFLESHEKIKEKTNHIMNLRLELQKEQISQIKQVFGLTIAKFLKDENIEEAQYLGFVGSAMRVESVDFYLDYGIHFDIKAPERQIDYAITPEEFKNEKLTAYATRRKSGDFPIIEKINKLAHAFNFELRQTQQEIMQLGEEIGIAFTTDKSFTQDITHNMSLIMTPEEFKVWNALKEQHDLAQQLPKSKAPSTKNSKNKI